MPRLKKTTKQELFLPTQIRTTRDLRIVLIEAFADIRAKRLTPGESRSLSNMAQAILNTIRVELVLARANIGEYKTIDMVAEQAITGNSKLS